MRSGPGVLWPRPHQHHEGWFLFWDKAGEVAARASAAFGMGVGPVAASVRLKNPKEMKSSRRSGPCLLWPGPRTQQGWWFRESPSTKTHVARAPTHAGTSAASLPSTYPRRAKSTTPPMRLPPRLQRLGPEAYHLHLVRGHGRRRLAPSRHICALTSEAAATMARLRSP
jgi:hypothetical protein